jgi:protein SCO1/2
MTSTIFARALRALIGILAMCVVAGTARAGLSEDIQSIRLIDQNGRTVTPRDLAGKPSLVVFGFTNCPSICPMALSEMADRMADLGPLAERLNVIFVTADPERDTAEVLRDYIGAFDRRIIGLTGTIAEVTTLAKAVGAEFRKVPLAGGGYTIDHSGSAFLMDRDWHRCGLLILGQGGDPNRATARLRELIGN